MTKMKNRYLRRNDSDAGKGATVSTVAVAENGEGVSEAGIEERRRVTAQRRLVRRGVRKQARQRKREELQVVERDNKRLKEAERALDELAQRRRPTPGSTAITETERIEANDGLPTATVTVDGVPRRIQLDSCARYLIAGTGWIKHGDRVEGEAPVDYVEGISGLILQCTRIILDDIRR
ncbi:hypothetical protein F442_14638 [Phytophthora nicotianae P10297]|uniref:Uncharacterized protein n=3 Tax=Phytophthora nicotianae TaxID=4792 RepID=W2PTG2_PHYN3|nr:hypothetical protein PPTG_14950 [Phytophthora nicotianae INRA-310]ETN04248.1 hypothetical protein PPTG_14950 [Phytophthora nicotianae INRA-310]ETO68337.1 hypothetical protein F444_14811 [Phytophthora nicotianae P1976]ETP37557.1 hypothetical protein F442_14638 [Phytophthora nicotianae P10297]